MSTVSDTETQKRRPREAFCAAIVLSLVVSFICLTITGDAQVALVGGAVVVLAPATALALGSRTRPLASAGLAGALVALGLEVVAVAIYVLYVL